MHILCLEQGDWMNPAKYPSAGRDWEARFYGDYSPSPNIRARREVYPVNDDNSPIKVLNFNGVGGSTDACPFDYDPLAPFFAENDRMMGVSGLAGDPGSPPAEPPMPPLPLGR